MHNYKIFCLSGSVIIVPQVTLKRVNIYHIVFYNMTLKSSFEPVQNDQNYQLKLTFGAHTNSSLQNLMVMFTFSVFEWKVLFKHAQLDFYIC